MPSLDYVWFFKHHFCFDISIKSAQYDENFKISEMKSSLKEEDSVRSQLEEIKIKMEEMENNKRNNLIVYGIPNDIRETHSSLHQKVCLHLRFSRYFFWAKAGDAHYQLFIGTILDIGYFQDQTPDSLQLATCKGKLRTRWTDCAHCVKVSRMTVGTYVGGCRPVVVAFKNFAEVGIDFL